MKLTLTIIIAIILAVILGISICHAQSITYTPITKNGEVESVDEVQVEIQKPITEKQVVTLQYINTELNKINARITELEAERAKYNALKTAIETEAKKVELKTVVKP